MKLLLFLCIVAIANCKSFEEVFKNEYLAAPDVARNGGQHWALLIAGSSGWGNYRHQADICHAYQVLKNNGIPESNIVVMMADDIAHNQKNPNKGKIINHPNGQDVYHGVPKDYTGKAVTPENFLNILQGRRDLMIDETGQTIGSGKVINSGPNDHIFVNFADHGGPGLVGFPSSVLRATQWNQVIKQMHNNGRYKQMVIYVEACESGSMFNKLLPNNINVFVTTAASPTQSSWGCYYDQQLQTCLGDVYSVKWMENSDKGHLSSETLQQQFRTVKKETTKSTVEEYGDLSIAKEKVAEFQGDMSFVSPWDVPRIVYPAVEMDEIPSPDIPLAILERRLAAATTETEKDEISEELRQELESRRRIAQLFKNVVSAVLEEDAEAITDVMERKQELTNHQCYDLLVTHFHDNCMNIAENDHTMRYLYTFVNLCEKGQTQESVIGAINDVCLHQPAL